MQVTIYGSRLSPFVEKVIRGVQRKGLAWELIEPKSPTDMKRWNPQTGKMPAADVAGERLYDSTFILRRLDELAPEPPLVSGDPVTAAHQRQLEDWADEALYWYVMAFRWQPKNGAASADAILRGLSLPKLLHPLVARVIQSTVRKQVEAQGTGRLPDSVLAREFGEKLDDVTRMLGDREFLFADVPSVADLAVFSQLKFADSDASPETRAAIQRRPKLVDYMKRVEQATGRQAAQAARSEAKPSGDRTAASVAAATQLSVLAALLLLAPAARADEAFFRACEVERRAALVNADGAALARLMQDGAQYVHSNGDIDDKAELIARLTSGELRYRNIFAEEERYACSASACEVSGTQKLDVSAGGRDVTLRNRFGVSWLNAGGACRFVAYQSRPLEPPAAK
jgi:glutathione S-transferase